MVSAHQQTMLMYMTTNTGASTRRAIADGAKASPNTSPIHRSAPSAISKATGMVRVRISSRARRTIEHSSSSETAAARANSGINTQLISGVSRSVSPASVVAALYQPTSWSLARTARMLTSILL